MKTFIPKGIIPALVTPMDSSGKLNIGALHKLLDYIVSQGVHGVFIVSSTGESYALNLNEKQCAITETVSYIAGRVPVYAGTGCITTRDTICLTRIAEKCGVDAVSVVTPSFISPTQKQLEDHYIRIAESTELPVILYNNVGRTGVNINPSTLAALSRIENIVGVKDSSGDMTQAAEYLRLTRGSEFSVLMGRDTLIYGGMCYGASGAIAASANVAPKVCVEIYEKFIADDIEGALDAQFKLAPLRSAFSLGTFPVVIKEALRLLGLDAGNCLDPVTPLNQDRRQELKDILDHMGLLGILK